MKTCKQLPTNPIMKHLSPDEQKVLLSTRHRRAAERHPSRHSQNGAGIARRTLIIVACVLGLAAAGSAPLNAAEPRAVSAPALFNDANAAQRAGRLGPAILDYERARVLAPGDDAIAKNLTVARGKAGVAAPIVPKWERPAFWLGFDTLAALASVSLAFFCLIFFGTRLIPTTLRRFSRGAATLLGASALLAAGAVALRWPELNRAVIVSAAPAGARIAPAANAAVSFQLKPGEFVSAENRYGAFVRIRTADGQHGWVSSAEIEKIIPSAS